MPTPRDDAVLFAAVEEARAGAESIAEPGTVGDHLGAVMDGDRLATHYFACRARSFVGWRWAVSLARVPRSKKATICETNLVPGEGSLLSPQWLPYVDRLAPGDLRAGDVLPFVVDDPRLEPGFEATGEQDVDQVALWELGLGRARVLSALGREEAAQRWYDGEHGPTAQVSAQAPARCASCGFFLPMSGALRAVFGVCANEWSPSDGSVVSLDHGCGAHSETDLVAEPAARVDSPVLDDFVLDVLV